MDLQLETDIATQYHSNAQRARVITERWMNRSMFCPVCGNAHLTQFEANRPVADFFCDNCKQQFELKSKEGAHPGKIITDGAYNTMIDRITSNNNPNLFYLTHENDRVTNLILIPRYFFTPDIIERRKPLSDEARRRGWVGCNINISSIPTSCKISIIDSGVIHDKETIVGEYNKLKSLKVDSLEGRGWLLDILLCLSRIPSSEFCLEQVYGFAPYLAQKHPENNFIQAKIRQQLQILRDKGYLRFMGHGVYQKCL
jgi:type II restriction enzyme